MLKEKLLNLSQRKYELQTVYDVNVCLLFLSRKVWECCRWSCR